MTVDSKSPGHEERKLPLLGIGKGFLIIGMAIVFFLLAQSMVRHRFCKGRQIEHLSTQTPIPIGP